MLYWHAPQLCDVGLHWDVLGWVYADETGLRAMAEQLDKVARNLPSRVAGVRFRKLMSASRSSKMHTQILFARPLGASVIAASGLPGTAKSAYIRLLQAIGDLWNKEPRR